ncbi:uncharacterized protein NDAI_0D03910 [Naumovozyma dairenensis CBS 421]|uniref:Uncharacterized protein n=1 Tax=Naumovozyma dairenensis (strain ATCC 10597 / BCRC 20456 / CBS 421 / NBRC 0211 / NRRL Y-12639) TaxID=1071378 RepID=G0WA94_NAUDC|nr:hypothetical protein NDAI_0D03910 [Naumovozyma dairenensis CBS 421]CCD24705.1 hypothetical protein NDAI_0D03910 [Naumovozyma dairenensis CBS 421]
MAGTIKIIRKKDPKKADPLARQKLIWTVGHTMTLVFGALFTLTYFFHVLLFFKYRSWKWLFLRVKKNYSIIKGTRWYHTILRWSPQLLYRLSLIGVFTSGSVTMFQNWNGLNPTWYDLLSSSNFQAMLMALLWFLGGGKSFYKLLPFMILSYMHLLDKDNEFNTESKKKEDQLTMANVHLLHLVSYSEIFIVIALVLDTLLMKNGSSGIMLVIYLGIYWLRLNFSPYAQITLLRILSKFDKKIPPKHKNNWDTIKRFIYAKMKAHERRLQEVGRTA